MTSAQSLHGYLAGWDTAGAAVDDLSRAKKLVSAICFVLFMASISRVGLIVMPPTTNLSWGVAYGLLAICVAKNPNLYFSLARRNAVLVITALFATLSAFWSLTPAITAYSGILLFLNVFTGFMFADRIGLRRTLGLIFWFCLIVQAASFLLILVHDPRAFDEAGNAKGLYIHKNNMSMHAVLLYFTAIALVMAAQRRLITAAAILLAVTNLLLSRSGTGLLMIAFTSAVLITCRVAMFHRRWASFYLGLLIIFACAFVLLVMLNQHSFAPLVLNALGKDETLTGRTVLWEKAWETYENYPWLGVRIL